GVVALSQKENKSSFFVVGFGRFVLLGVVIQSILIGGGYVKEHEVVKYDAGYGALGWITSLTMLVVFAIMAFLMFEIARLFRAYDYRSLVKQVLGPFWFLYDIIYFLLAILIIGIVIAATGSILESTLSLNYWVGVTLIAVLAGVLNFYGTKWIERFKTFG